MDGRTRFLRVALLAAVAELGGFALWLSGHLTLERGLELGLVVFLLILTLMAAWHLSFPGRAGRELPKLMPKAMRESDRLRLRRLWRKRHVWEMAWRMPMGATASGWIQNREAIEQRLNCSVRVWDDGGLVRMRFGVKALPGRVDYSDFIRTPGSGELPIPIGDSREGRLWPDLAEVKNLLLGGAIGGGKSTVLNAIVVWIAEHFAPQEVQLVLLDLKGGDGVEFGMYNVLPHLSCPVVTRLEDCEAVFEELQAELELRNQQMRAAGVKKLEDYNRLPAAMKTARGLPVLLPRKLVIVDEFAEIWGLGKQAARVVAQVESLTRTGRAAGEHFIFATQRPDVNVIPGQIRNNFLAVLAFYCGDEHSSGVLLGPGDFRAHTLDPADPGLAIWKHRTSSKVRTVWLSAQEAQARVNRLAGGISVQALPQASIEEAPELGPGASESRLVKALRMLSGGAQLPQVSTHWQKD